LKSPYPGLCITGTIDLYLLAAGAGLADAPPDKTGFTAWRMAIAGFILPYMFVCGPELLMVGSWPDIVLASITSTAGVFLLAASVQGYLLKKVMLWERIVLFAAALLLIKPGILTIYWE
jgi:TRAP-type uncharacterized transport system fused permease subunit